MEYSATTDDGIAYPLCAYMGYRYRKPSYNRRRVFAYPHCSAIALAIPGNVLLLRQALSAGDLALIRAS